VDKKELNKSAGFRYFAENYIRIQTKDGAREFTEIELTKFEEQKKLIDEGYEITGIKNRNGQYMITRKGR
jgi:hypothetical protein